MLVEVREGQAELVQAAVDLARALEEPTLFLRGELGPLRLRLGITSPRPEGRFQSPGCGVSDTVGNAAKGIPLARCGRSEKLRDTVRSVILFACRYTYRATVCSQVCHPSEIP